MADHTKIEWTDATWNVITGCSVVSPGCTNCYAMKLAGTRLRNIPSRAGLTRDSKAGPVWNGTIRFNEEWLDQPLRWRRPRMIFVCAHGDLFAEGVTDDMLDQVFAVMALAPQHVFQVLTKRPVRMRDYLRTRAGDWMLHWPDAARKAGALLGDMRTIKELRLPLPNVWLGVSVEDQRRADERIPILLDTPAAVRWISAEPLLGPVDLTSIDTGSGWVDSLQSYIHYPMPSDGHFRNEPIDWPHLDWIVAGGESGPSARPMHPEWVRSIRDQCAAAGVPFLFKQWGAWAPICEMSEAATDRCYRSNRRAKEGESQKTVDESYGRTRIVPSHVLHRDGSQHDNTASMAFRQGTGAMTMFAIGKKSAGRLLDGQLHDAVPRGRDNGDDTRQETPA
ncbi:DUF5131 family protein [Aurantimonas coralicida]|uniref:DUF5131 family protein n=1 Tax=Aurantimonas coralicida TaxID=182270 RepID=UPI001D183107|nr:phage Gp37/Gp68 family protein [Aurantimonas coralicida]MCC4299348.1 phage Gp37/Gp68 family protein [Aurantimonas coralicida]